MAAFGYGADRLRTLVSMATDNSHSYNCEKKSYRFFSVVFHPILFILAVNEDMHLSSDEIEVWPNRTTLSLWKIPIDLQFEKCCCHSRAFIFSTKVKHQISRFGVQEKECFMSLRY